MGSLIELCSHVTRKAIPIGPHIRNKLVSSLLTLNKLCLGLKGLKIQKSSFLSGFRCCALPLPGTDQGHLWHELAEVKLFYTYSHSDISHPSFHPTITCSYFSLVCLSLEILWFQYIIMKLNSRQTSPTLPWIDGVEESIPYSNVLLYSIDWEQSREGLDFGDCFIC